jgi:hypothetical protein
MSKEAKMAAKKTSSKAPSGSPKAPSSAGRVSVPGLGSSKGMQGFLVLPESDVGLECVSCKIKASEKSPCDLWNFSFKVLDGDNAGKRWSHRVTILSEAHPSYNTIGIDELKSMALAFGIKVGTKEDPDAVVPESFIGLIARAKVGQKMGTDAQGNEKAENTVREWYAQE